MLSKSRRLSACFLQVFLLCLPIRLPALFAAALTESPVEAYLVSEVSSIQPGRPFTVALVLKMKPDWHVYWKNPGDSGLPTRLEWQLPPGFQAGPLLWPVPERFDSEGLVTYGYSGRVLLLTEITPPDGIMNGDRIDLSAHVEWLACRVECIPGAASLQVSLRVRPFIPLPDSAWKKQFGAARSSLPGSVAGASFRAVIAGDRLVLHGEGIAVPPGASVAFYPEDSGLIAASAAQKLSGGRAGLDLTLERAQGAPSPERLHGILVFGGAGGENHRGVQVDAPVAMRAAAPATGIAGAFSLLLALLFAFAGGVILNLMPCVLPVISLKVLSLVRQSEQEGRGAPVHGLLFSAGVLLSFWVMAAILASVRAGGRLLGWGFQLQNSSVVVVAAALFFLIALNLFGVYPIGTSLTRLGGLFRRGRGGAGSFLNGLFAAVVATPCTAPFMGAAIGYALSKPLPVIFGVFTMLGIGMAAPYLVLSAVPRLAARLPKPGPWMETLRQVMGFPMLSAVIWMVFVLSALAGGSSVIVLLSGLLAAGIGAWAWGRWGGLGLRRRTRVIAAAASVIFAVGGPVIAAGFIHGMQATTSEADFSQAWKRTTLAPRWEPWSKERVDQLRGQGTPVLIDFTARWCITCQVNERVALGNAAVTQRLAKLGVATLRADWTSGSELIARGLAAFGRASVPLYVYYPAGAEQPEILPELLTPGIVLKALDRPARASQ
jgi:thiol:disulfide interchange protein DsbD